MMILEPVSNEKLDKRMKQNIEQTDLMVAKWCHGPDVGASWHHEHALAFII